MENYQLKDTTPKTIRFENELLIKIQELADESERVFSEQIRFMLKKYLQMIEKK